MKNILFSLLIIYTLGLIPASAQEYVVTSVARQQKAQIAIADTEVVLGVTAATKQVAVSTHSQFTVTAADSWCTAAVKDKAVSLDVSANSGAARRSTTVTVRSKDGLTQTLRVVQLGTTPEVVVSPAKVEVVDDKLQFTIEVASSVEPVFKYPDWISGILLPKGAGTKVYTFKASALTDVAEREGRIGVSGQNAAATNVDVYQYTHQYPSFAVISDVHFGNTQGDGPMVKVPRALKVLSERKDLDAIFVVGDLANTGAVPQYQQLVSVFSDSANFKHPIARKVFMMGNHDNLSGLYNYANELSPFNDGQSYPYDQYIVIKGYPFITISPRASAGSDDYNNDIGTNSYPKAVQDTLKKWLARAAKECPGKPIFVFTHIPPKYTCYSTWPGEGEGDGTPTWSMKVLNPILNKYPQAVVFCGHSHYPLGDPRSIHQGVDPKSDKQNYYTVINTGSTTYTEIEEPGVENGGYPAGYDNVTEGLVVSVQPQGNVEIRRYDTKRDEEIRPDQRWLLKAPFDGSQFAYADIRDKDDNVNNRPLRTGLPAPAFDEDTRIETSVAGGNATVTFKQAKDDDMTLRYKIQLINEKGYADRCEWRYAGDYLNSDKPEYFTYTFGALPIGKTYTVKVEAYDSYSNASAPITGEPFTVRLDETNTPPAATGRWDFADDNDWLKTVEGSSVLTPCTVTTGGQVTDKTGTGDVNMARTTGPNAEKKAVTIGADCALRMTTGSDQAMSTYTIMWDMKTVSSGYSAILQPDNTNRSDCALCMSSSSTIGIAQLGYYSISPTWHRVVLSVKEGVASLYIDGQHRGSTSDDANGRFILSPNNCLLFSDDNGETGPFDVSQIAFWNQALTGPQIAALGAAVSETEPSLNIDQTEINAADRNSITLKVSGTVEPSFSCPDWIHLKRPVPSIGNYTYEFSLDRMSEVGTRSGDIIVSGPEGCGLASLKCTVKQTKSGDTVPNAVGVWTFDDDEDLLINSTDAEYYLEPATIGSPDVNIAGTPAEAGIVRVEGPTATNKAVLCPANSAFNIAYEAEGGMSNYTLMYDVNLPKIGQWCALLQTDLTNKNDADLCIGKKGTVGLNVSGLGYGGQVYENEWHRIVFVVRNNIPSTYLDGVLLRTATEANQTWELNPAGLYLFCDNDGETSDINVAEIRFWDQALSDHEVSTLGAIDYPHINIHTKEVTLADNATDFTLEVSSSVKPKFNLPDWISYVGESEPAAGIHSYEFAATKMTSEGERQGTITIVNADGSDTPAPASITVTQSNHFSIPEATGRWNFNHATDYFTTSEGTARLTPYTIADLQPMSEAGETDFPQVEGPAEGNMAISVNSDFCFRLQLDETDRISNYTLLYDIMLPNIGWESLLQTDLQNSDDGDLFVNKDGRIGLGVTALGYSGKIEAGKWYRIVLVVRDGIMNVYVDGRLIKAGSATSDDRWIQDKTGCWILCDNDGENVPSCLAGLRFWNTPLSDTQIQKLGSAGQ